MKVSVRRLRAVLLFSTVSALVWGIVSVLFSIGFALRNGTSLDAIHFIPSMIAFAFCGFVAGSVYSIGIAMAPRKGDPQGLSAVRSAISGAVGGGLVFLVVSFGLGELNTATLLTPLMVFSAVGGVTGIAIQRAARRGALPAGDAPNLLVDRPEEQ